MVSKKVNGVREKLQVKLFLALVLTNACGDPSSKITKIETQSKDKANLDASKSGKTAELDRNSQVFDFDRYSSHQSQRDTVTMNDKIALDSELASKIDAIDTISTIDAEEKSKVGHVPRCADDMDQDSNGTCQEDEIFESEGVAFSCTKQNFTVTKVPDKFVAINPYADTLWPGALIQTKGLMSGILNPVPAQSRSAGEITMAIASDTSGFFSKGLPTPSLASATEAIKDILNTNVDIATPAKFHYQLSHVHSSKQLNVALGIHVDTPFDFDIQANLDFNAKKVRNRILVDFTQEYYTIAYSPQSGIKGFFSAEQDSHELEPFMGPSNPLAYISSVSYGRKIYLLFESSAKMSELESAIKASFQGYGVAVGGGASLQSKKVLSESEINAYVLGGNAEEALKTLNTTDEETGGTIVNLQALMQDGANFSKGNPGVPISYAVRHVKDASQIKLVLTTDYTARECAPIGNVENPAIWSLKVTLDSVEIEKENSFCESTFNKTGEFSSCLQVHIGETGDTIDIFCAEERRKAKAGEILEYGQSNHSMIVDVIQRPGQSITTSGHVYEHDSKTKFIEVLKFDKKFLLSPSYEWTDWSEELSVTGVKNGCKATLKYQLEWVDKFLARP